MYCLRTIHALFTSPMTLFTHLKMILLQCLQFSVFNKISCIQTDTKVWFGLGLFMSAFYSFTFLPFFYFILLEVGFTWGIDLPVGTVHSARDLLAFWTSTHWFEVALFVGPMHYSQDPQTSFFTQTLIKNGSHSTIHIFKNYFATIFSIFSKISCIQTDLKKGSNKR